MNAQKTDEQTAIRYRELLLPLEEDNTELLNTLGTEGWQLMTCIPVVRGISNPFGKIIESVLTGDAKYIFYRQVIDEPTDQLDEITLGEVGPPESEI